MHDQWAHSMPALDRLLADGDPPSMNISIFGLGYVGAVSLACLARNGHRVIGVDIDPGKLELIRRGQTPIIETGMAELMRTVVESGRVQVTDDAVSAVHRSELSAICVGTPSLPNGAPDRRAVERCTAQLGAAMRSKSDYHVFVIRSTVFPGTVEEVLIPLLEQHAGKRVGRDFDVCFQPEFLREGSSIQDFEHPPFTIVGATSERAVGVVREMLGQVGGTAHTCAIRTAEVLKYACNAFHALKITFANEIGRVCQAVAVDPHEVMELLCEDKQLNISKAYLRPGFAYGGSCLPKDLRALRHLAGRSDVAIPMLSAVAQSNDAHIEHALQIVLDTGLRHIGMVGLSFKPGTDDLRESPLVVLAERFIGKGLTLRIWDPDVTVSRLAGANRRYIEETIPHIGALIANDLGAVVDGSQAVIVSLATEPVLRVLQSRGRPDHFILDLVNLPNKRALPGLYRGICW
jgi:GDP-mannose 6-dehydrogenase